MVLTNKQIFNKKYKFEKDKAHSISDISKITGYKISGLKTIYAKGVGAYYSNPKSVRKNVKSPQQWSMARIYSAVNPKSKAHKLDKIHLVKKPKIN